MAKIEEITALLIDEIEDFKNSIEELKKESDKLHKKKFIIDTSQIKTAFKEFDKKLSADYDHRLEEVSEIQKKLNKKIIIPKWMIILFSSFFIITILSLTFNIYQLKKTEEIKETAHENGLDEMRDHMKNYFDDNPNSLKQYQIWLNKK